MTVNKASDWLIHNLGTVMVFIAIITGCVGVLPPHFPALSGGNVERDELIERYFSIGLGY